MRNSAAKLSKERRYIGISTEEVTTSNCAQFCAYRLTLRTAMHRDLLARIPMIDRKRQQVIILHRGPRNLLILRLVSPPERTGRF